MTEHLLILKDIRFVSDIKNEIEIMSSDMNEDKKVSLLVKVLVDIAFRGNPFQFLIQTKICYFVCSF